MTAEPFDVALGEFAADVNTSITTVLLATVGLGLVRERFGNLAEVSPDNPDPFIGLGAGPPDTTRPHGGWHRSELLARTAKDGAAHVALRQQWLVAFYDRWDSYWRHRLAAALGMADSKDLKVPAMGDLRRMRNDVSHNRGIASAQWTGKCEVLKFFEIGEVIQIRDDHFFQLVDAMPWPIPLGRPNR